MPSRDVDNRHVITKMIIIFYKTYFLKIYFSGFGICILKKENDQYILFYGPKKLSSSLKQRVIFIQTQAFRVITIAKCILIDQH